MKIFFNNTLYFIISHKFKVVIFMINAILVIIGTVVGAGFASGKEIFVFFNVYGLWGFIGLFVSFFVMGLIVYKVFQIIIDYNVSSYSEFVDTIISKSVFTNTVVCNTINVFLLISFIVMVSGFSAYFAQQFKISHIFGALLIVILSFFVFLKNIDGIAEISKIFVPFLVVIILIMGFKNWECICNLSLAKSHFNLSWLLNALLYASYNLIILFPMLINLRKYITNIRQAKVVSLISSVSLLIMAIILFAILNYYYSDIKHLELPTVHILSNLGVIYKYACGLLVLGAIFTTAISSGYGFLSNFSLTNRKRYIALSTAMCAISILLSNIGFSKLLNSLYPILGLLRFYTNYFYCNF